MRKIKLLILISILFSSICSAESFSQNHNKVKALFQSNEEPTAKDAVWTANDIFKVGVINDGSNRNGYAQYVCEVLYDYGFKGEKIWVQIIDIVQLTQKGKWTKLGEAKCS